MIRTLALLLAAVPVLPAAAQTPPALAAQQARVLNVRDHGVRCDGRTDDRAAIAAVLATAASGPRKLVYFPPSTTPCMMDSDVTLPSGVTLWAEPGTATIKATAANRSVPLLFTTGSRGARDVLVHGLTIDGNVAGQTGLQGAHNRARLISIYRSARVVFDQVAFRNSYGTPLQFSTAISYSGVRNSSFDQVGMHGRVSGMKADYKQGVSLIDTAPGASVGNFIDDNRFSNVGFDAVNVSFQKRLSVRGNRIELGGQQWYAGGVGCAGVFIVGSSEVAVIGNVVDRASGVAFDLPGNDHLTVVGNRADKAGTNGFLIGTGASYGVLTGARNFVIADNVAMSSGQHRSSRASGLIFTRGGTRGSISNGLVAGNVLSDDQARPTQPYGILLYDSGFGQPALANVQIDATNRMTGNTIAPTSGIASAVQDSGRLPNPAGGPCKR